ncbi:hypothetical protein [Mycolicibacterium frederiksbergense]|uniref:hypothetical protein n=1 Tax=Mycolicibacterium frederiksbergense TaxID=117567 RepID=UPI00265BFC58|nr:hypothetical protein [Mycolicibacterium frederiksbergense]MDO0976960.1 hypothetical protein [Mycolicibacterium frederiksbergense]
MTDIIEAEVVLTEREAADITARIRTWVNAFPVDDITAAFTGRIWLTMGYASWSEYLDAEFDFAGRLRLPALERVEAVAALAESGMSEVAISETLGIARNTVRKDKATQPVQSEQVVGKDGRTRKKPAKSNVVELFPDAAEQADVMAMADVTDEQFEDALVECRAEGDLSRENVAAHCGNPADLSDDEFEEMLGRVPMPADTTEYGDWDYDDGGANRTVLARDWKCPVDVRTMGQQRDTGATRWYVELDCVELSAVEVREVAATLLEAADELERRQAQ